MDGRGRWLLGLGATIVVGLACHRDVARARAGEAELALPPPHTSGGVALDDALARRRSRRALGGAALTDAELGQLLWAAQGVTDREQGLRAAPSAGALYPLVVYVVTGAGVQRYEPATHGLRFVARVDRRDALSKAAHGQAVVGGAPASLVVVGIVARTRAKYGARAERFVTLEAGHAVQNVLLEATALGLGAVPIGAFDDDAVRAVVEESADALPLYVVPLGRS